MYSVITLPEMYEEWKEEMESVEEMDALRLAQDKFEAGLFMVEVYEGDRLLWRNGQYASPFYPSPFEMEWINRGGEPGLVKVPIYEYKTDKSYMQELAEEGVV